MLHRVALFLSLASLIGATSALARDDDSPPFGWALASPKGSTIATSTDELSRLDASTADGERVLFVRFGQAEYLIRDRATLDRADQLVEPVRKLGERAREIVAARGERRSDKREWKERLRPYKEKRRELLNGVSDEMEALARESIRRGQAARLN